ncbi:MAG: DUF2017 family protein [Acidimicrobiaceae bacterium]|jgi:hypothetical protein|nr:DUF2017 family protein [Acidimicrobiaceae bacterium]MBT5581499.1 DUF2017 family protein [Acidimicrobiaceae bacterium]MBT5851649.1 DUF2017 family protein [Acidimicrobiaceae bacterium]
MSVFRHHRFRWVDNVIRVDLPTDEQDLLRTVLPQLREMLMAADDPALHRLSPPSRPDDDEAEATYRGMVDDDLLIQRLEAIEVVEEGIDGVDLDEDGVAAWMQSLNALRLVLAARLDIDILGHDPIADLDDEDPLMPIAALYEWLGFLLGSLVDEAMDGFDD